MRLITKKDLIRSTPARWAESYKGSRYYEHTTVTQKLNSLNLGQATEQKITDIIGNSSWTAITCNECCADVDVAVEIGEDRCESSITIICLSCLEKGIKLIQDVL